MKILEQLQDYTLQIGEENILLVLPVDQNENDLSVFPNYQFSYSYIINDEASTPTPTTGNIMFNKYTNRYDLIINPNLRFPITFTLKLDGQNIIGSPYTLNVIAGTCTHYIYIYIYYHR